MEREVSEANDQLNDYAQRLDELEMRRDQNVQERHIIEKTKQELEEFYAWSTRWRAECEAMSPTDPHSRMLLESLSVSIDEARSKSDQVVEDMIEDNRLDALQLATHKEILLEERKRLSIELEEDGGI